MFHLHFNANNYISRVQDGSFLLNISNIQSFVFIKKNEKIQRKLALLVRVLRAILVFTKLSRSLYTFVT